MVNNPWLRNLRVTTRYLTRERKGKGARHFHRSGVIPPLMRRGRKLEPQRPLWQWIVLVLGVGAFWALFIVGMAS